MASLCLNKEPVPFCFKDNTGTKKACILQGFLQKPCAYVNSCLIGVFWEVYLFLPHINQWKVEFSFQIACKLKLQLGIRKGNLEFVIQLAPRDYFVQFC